MNALQPHVPWDGYREQLAAMSDDTQAALNEVFLGFRHRDMSPRSCAHLMNVRRVRMYSRFIRFGG